MCLTFSKDVDERDYKAEKNDSGFQELEHAYFYHMVAQYRIPLLCFCVLANLNCSMHDNMSFHFLIELLN